MKKFNLSALRAFLQLLLISFLFSSCEYLDLDQSKPEVLVPENATGTEADALPEGALFMDEAEFQVKVASGDLILTSPHLKEKTALKQAKELEADRKIIEDFIQDNRHLPHLRDLLLGEAKEEAGVLRKLGDGNYELTWTDRFGEEHKVMTLGPDAMRPMIAGAISRYKMRENHILATETLYQAFESANLGWLIEEFNYPSLAQVQEMSQFELLDLRRRFVLDADSLMSFAPIPPAGGTPPKGFPETCDDEIGAAGFGDRSTNQNRPACDIPAVNGLYSNFNWPMKFDTTCVKDQGFRGSCTAFAIAGAMEVMIARHQRQWVNLSEQDLYYRVKRIWWPSNYGDGAHSDAIWRRMSEDGYYLPFENQWPYNPSWSRFDNQVDETYSRSCLNYNLFSDPVSSDFCSDTNHQGGYVCTYMTGYLFCGHFAPVPLSNRENSSGFRADSHIQLWDASDVDHSIIMTQLYLAFGIPTVVGLRVTPAFDRPDADGFMVGMDNSTSRGGHAVLITGVINNSQIEKRLPNAPLGAGGGYFIIKNSWSTCFGDAGYIYIPFDWFKTEVTSMAIGTFDWSDAKKN
jgi:C1A family cysteine protease